MQAAREQLDPPEPLADETPALIDPMKASPHPMVKAARPAIPYRWIGGAALVGAIACNAVLGIEEAELVCSGRLCPDAGTLRIEDESLRGDGTPRRPGAGVGPGGSSTPRDGGADAASEPVGIGSPGTELDPDLVRPPNTGGSGNAPGGGDQSDDENSGLGDGTSGGNSGPGSDDSNSGPGSGGDSSDGNTGSSDGNSGNGGNGGTPPTSPSPCQGRSAGAAFCDGSIRVSCGANGTVASAEPCPTPALCQASRGATCAACLPGEARCNGDARLSCNANLTGFDTERCASAALCSTTGCRAPACAATDTSCRGRQLERCSADLTALETIDCGSPSLCNAAEGRCNNCVPNAARCENGTTAAICDSAGLAETFVECSTLSVCVRGVCEVLGIGL